MIYNRLSWVCLVNFRILLAEFISQLACLHDQSKIGVFEEPAFFSQSGLFENFSDCSIWLDKSRPSKKATFVLIM